jgi:hypothetical protein
MRRVGSFWEFACEGCGYVVQTACKPGEPRCPRCVVEDHLEQAAAQFPAMAASDAQVRRDLENALQRISELEDELAELRRGAA